MLIAVDVDLTVVDTLTPWMHEFQLVTGGRKVENKDGNYSLEPEMNRILKEVGIKDYDPMSYWYKKDLYDHVNPLPTCKDVLFSLHKQGHEIVFVSSCIPEHIDSKKDLLWKHFRYAAGFIDTVDKHWVDYDVLIDDRIKHIDLGHKHRPDSKHIMFTGVRQDGLPEESSSYLKAINWTEVHCLLS